jgi:hypothetical protein
MSLQAALDRLFVTPESMESLAIIREHVRTCESILEFGSRGGVSALAGFQALLDKKPRLPPRFVGVDLIEDDTIKTLTKMAETVGISFQFCKVHTRQHPLHETDCLFWDVFHTGGSLLADLERWSPWIQKCIVILGTNSDGQVSEAVRRNLDIAAVARELQSDEAGTKMGLKPAIAEFLKTHTDWIQVREFGEITILQRQKPPSTKLFIK